MRKLIPAAVFGFLILTLASCGGGAKSKTVVSYMFWSNSPEELSITEKLVKAFEEENPDIKVKMINTPPNEYYQKLSTAIAANEAPDVFYIQPERFAAFYVRNVLAPLNEFIEKDPDFKMENYFPQIIEAFSENGLLYATPRDVANYVVFYNKDLFDQFGVPYPKGDWTWKDFVKTAQMLTKDTDGDGKIDIFGTTGYNLYSAIYEAGGKILDDSGKRCLLSSPQAIEAMQFYTDLLFKYHVAPLPEETGDRTATELFKTGAVAMDINGRWWVPPYRQITKFEWDVAPLPRYRKKASVLLGLGHAVYANSKHKQEAYKLAAFLAKKKAMEMVGKLGIAIPALLEVAYSEVFLDPSQPPKNAKVFLDTVKYSIPLPRTPHWNEVERILQTKFEKVIYEKEPVPKIAREITEEVNALLQEEQ